MGKSRGGGRPLIYALDLQTGQYAEVAGRVTGHIERIYIVSPSRIVLTTLVDRPDWF
jgi:hypothetical protein